MEILKKASLWICGVLFATFSCGVEKTRFSAHSALDHRDRDGASAYFELDFLVHVLGCIWCYRGRRVSCTGGEKKSQRAHEPQSFQWAHDCRVLGRVLWAGRWSEFAWEQPCIWAMVVRASTSGQEGMAIAIKPWIWFGCNMFVLNLSLR